MTLTQTSIEGEAPASPSPTLPEVGEATVRMRAFIAGTRNGVDWPPVGGLVTLPAIEAGDLVRGGLAELVEVVEAAAPAKPRRSTAKQAAKATDTAAPDEA